ncbi:MAG: hypothetical protein J0L82_03705 [Deltaproteobacteria bacterium]|jgi:hypothetical protein|nr:hypothetical protein [Deltaproteobacteria bacterium]
MSNRNRTLWLAAIIVISLGLMIEAMKTSRSTTAAGARHRSGLFGFASLEDESSPELGSRNRRGISQMLAADRARARLQGRLSGGRLANDRIAGLDADIDAAPLPAATPAAANLANPLKINTAEAEKKKAEDAKKKKKKKKKKTAEKQNGSDVTVTGDSDDDSEKDNDISPGGMGPSSVRSIVRSTGPGAKQVDESNDPETLEDWIAYIMPEPSYERTMKMVEAVQQRRMDPSIFHDVIAEMLADSRGKMQEHAVLALGSYPSLKSFLMLQSTNFSISETSPLKIQSRNHLKNYSRLENLRYLASLISSAGSGNSSSVDTNVLFEALRLIHLSADFYSGNVSSSGGSGSPTPPKPAATPPSVVRQFNPLVPALNRIAQTSDDSNIRQEASQALRQVQVITGT